jgi:hypothetical protein
VYSEIYNKENIDTEFKDLLQNLKPGLRNIQEEILVLKDETLSIQTRFQFIFSFKAKNKIQKSLLEMMINYALLSEKTIPGTFDRVIQNIAENYRKLDHKIGLDNYPTSSQMVCRPPVKEDISKWVISPLKSKDRLCGSLFESAISLAGFGGKIFVEKSSAQVNSIELVSGYSFPVTNGWDTNTKFKNARAICIDGYVESVSEIHHLLEDSSSSKESLLLVSRGFSNDVLHTLRVNWDRGSLKVFPTIVPFDLEGINAINDIAIVSGGDLVSSTKGDLISSIKIHNYPTVDEINILPGKIILLSKKSKNRVSSHIEQLKRKREDKSEIEDLSRLIDKRIKSLTPSQVIIKFVDDRDFVKRSQLIDIGLRQISSIMNTGIISAEKEGDFSAEICIQYFSERFFSYFQGLGAVISA